MPQLSPMNWMIMPFTLHVLFIYMNINNIPMSNIYKTHKQKKINMFMKW